MSGLDCLPVLIFLAALLYSSVGHAGASGYLAAMALCGVAPEAMKPSALLLNILVGTIGTIKFYRAGCFSWSIFMPFALGSIPLAFVGGGIALPGTIYKQVVGVILLFAAYRLFLARTTDKAEGNQPVKPVSFPMSVGCGAGIGLLSGLTGTGGGIFLTPLLLFMGWAETKQSAGVSVAFILVNSVAGIIGHYSKVKGLPDQIVYWVIAAGIGGLLGSELGSRRLGNVTLRRLLAVVLIIAGFKLILV